jgi:hypothetical protein
MRAEVYNRSRFGIGFVDSHFKRPFPFARKMSDINYVNSKDLQAAFHQAIPISGPLRRTQRHDSIKRSPVDEQNAALNRVQSLADVDHASGCDRMSGQRSTHHLA